MRLRPIVPVLLLLCGAASTLHAQPQTGDVELQFTGSILSTIGQDEGSSTSGIFQAKAGYFVSDRVEIGAFPSLVFTRTKIRPPGWPDVPETTVSESKFGMGLFGVYSFLAADASTVPYVGGQLYRIDLTDDDETGWAGVNGGLKFYLNTTTAFDVGGNVLWNLGERGGTLLLFQMGLGFLF